MRMVNRTSVVDYFCRWRAAHPETVMNEKEKGFGLGAWDNPVSDAVGLFFNDHKGNLEEVAVPARLWRIFGKENNLRTIRLPQRAVRLAPGAEATKCVILGTEHFGNA